MVAASMLSYQHVYIHVSRTVTYQQPRSRLCLGLKSCDSLAATRNTRLVSFTVFSSTLQSAQCCVLSRQVCSRPHTCLLLINA